MNRKTKHHYERLTREEEMVLYIIIIDSSIRILQYHWEKVIYLFFYVDAKEDIHRVMASSSMPLIYEPQDSSIHAPFTSFYSILKRLGR